MISHSRWKQWDTSIKLCYDGIDVESPNESHPLSTDMLCIFNDIPISGVIIKIQRHYEIHPFHTIQLNNECVIEWNQSSIEFTEIFKSALHSSPLPFSTLDDAKNYHLLLVPPLSLSGISWTWKCWLWRAIKSTRSSQCMQVTDSLRY